MTSRSLRESIEVQIIETQKLIDIIGEHPVMTFSLKQKLAELQAKLEAIPIGYKEAKVILFFSGKPVLGSEGIDAFFAGKVLPPFQDMISTDFAQRKHGKVGGRGQAKSQKEAQLFITALPRGSFGIELTKLENQNLFDDSELADTLVHVTGLIEASAKSDEDFAAAIDETSPRTIKDLKHFLEVVSSEHAGVTIESGGIRCELSEEAARIAFDRVSVMQTEEKEVTIEGVLRGATLDSWRFDFTPNDGKRFSGRISDELTEDDVKGFIVGFLDKNCNAIFEESTVTFKNSIPKKVYKLLGVKSRSLTNSGVDGL